MTEKGYTIFGIRYVEEVDNMRAWTKDGKMMSYGLAAVVTMIWSITFVSTKFLLNYLSPAEILLYRVILAYFIFVMMDPRFIRPVSLREECRFALMGFLGTTLYFLGENFALEYGTASNVSLLVSTAPLLTGIVAHFFVKSERLTKRFAIGGLFCLGGVSLIIFNGHFILKLSPVGDFFALAAALSFAFYSVTVRNMSRGYAMTVITRKSFFYALLTLLPLTLTPLINWHPQDLFRVDVLLNLLFLGALASAFCYLAWNKVIWALGAVKANNLIYLTPPLVIINAAVILRERITPFAVAGGLLILVGVYISQK